jgi:hypothetical protein
MLSKYPLIQDKYNEVVRLQNVLNSDSQALREHPVFANHDPISDDLCVEELIFRRIVVWLYSLYFEAIDKDSRQKKTLIAYFREKVPQWNSTVSNIDIAFLKKHPEDVGSLRARLVHHITHGENNTRQKCERWFNQSCQFDSPQDFKGWETCSHQLLLDAVQFLGILLKIFKDIEEDTYQNTILDDLSNWKQQALLPSDNELKSFVEEIGQDMGKIVKETYVNGLVNAYKGIWNDSLYKARNQGVTSENRKEFLRQMIESSILDQDAPRLPIHGGDILRAFSEVQPGEQLAQLLKKAKSLYILNNHFTRQDLLDYLRNEIESIT